MSIYVEIFIRAPLDDLWSHTQVPALHQRWDLRFSRIDSLPPTGDAPQRFRYSTRIGFGLHVSGNGETTGQRSLPDGSSTSALRFASNERLSIIREGRGYWKYIPTRDGVRFLTWYDYGTRFGAAGALFDRLVFRPLIGWATAWSFDRLRLWIEDRVDPRTAVRHTVIHSAARVALALVFAYQGLVPKLLAHDVDEIVMMRAAGIPGQMTRIAVDILALGELALASLLLARWSRTWPVWLTLIAMPIATVAVATTSPAFFKAAFNPFSLNVSVGVLAAIDLFVIGGVPFAGRCRRRPARERT